MESKKIWLDSFCITGIDIRTRNINGESSADIASLWERFFKEGLPEKLFPRLSEDLYCVYFDYESEANAYYKTLLGYKTDGTIQGGKFYTHVNVPAGEYLEFESIGQQPQTIMNTWAHIWSSPLNRKFLTDFDLYPHMQQNTVRTYLTVSYH